VELVVIAGISIRFGGLVVAFLRIDYSIRSFFLVIHQIEHSFVQPFVAFTI